MEASTTLTLTLVVTSESTKGEAAMAMFRHVLRRYDSCEVKYTVCDLAGSGCTFMPCIVREGCGPLAVMIGDLRNPERLVELLRECGVYPVQ